MSNSKPISVVMLVDDNPADNDYHTMILEDSNLVETVSIAFNGKDAIEHIESVAGTDAEPQLIFLDVNMPIMNGFEFLDAFTELGKKRELKSRVVVMLTTSLLEEDRVKAEDYNVMRQFMEKPLTEEAVVEIFEKYQLGQ